MEIQDITTIIGVCVGIVGVIFGLLQLSEIKKATYANAYNKALDILQSDDIRMARKYVLQKLQNKNITEWTEEDIKNAEKVCQSYDVVGIMIRNGMLPLEVIVDSWGSSLRLTWATLKPFVENHRSMRGATEFWDDFEYLASEAQNFKKKKK